MLSVFPLRHGSSIKLVNVPQCAKFVKISFYFLCFCEALMCHMWHMRRHLRKPALRFCAWANSTKFDKIIIFVPKSLALAENFLDCQEYTFFKTNYSILRHLALEGTLIYFYIYVGESVG